MSKDNQYQIGITVLGALFFIPFLGGVHLFDWDEINFAECAREMLLTGDYLRSYMEFKPFYEKPPLFFWFQALSMKVFGVNEFAARFPNAICGIVTLLVLFSIGKNLYDRRFGLAWVAAYMGSILPFLYFKSGIIDPWFNLFIFLGLYFFILHYWRKKLPTPSQSHTQNLERRTQNLEPRTPNLVWGGLFLGLAMLTKGPVALIVTGLCLAVYWVTVRFRLYVKPFSVIIYVIVAIGVTGVWYGLETAVHGPTFMKEFFIYQYRLFSTPDAGHGGFPGYHVVVLLIGCFPASLIGLRAFFKMPSEGSIRDDFRKWMLILFGVVLVLFSIVQSKIIHYSSLCYFPLTFLAALVLWKLDRGEMTVPHWLKWALLGIGGLIGLVVMATPIIGQHIDWIAPILKGDVFALATLEAEVPWGGWEGIGGLVLIALMVRGVSWLSGGHIQRGTMSLFGGTAIFVMLVLVLFIGKIERYSQGEAIDFFKRFEGKDVYVKAFGYKSYAPPFYSKMTPDLVYKSDYWLFRGDIDKDVYLATKIHKAPIFHDIDGFVELYRKNGFVFFKRECSQMIKD